MVATPSLSDTERFPMIDESGLAFLDALRQHPNGPLYNMACGDRLTKERVANVAAFERALLATPVTWERSAIPRWVLAYAEARLKDVPLFRKRGGSVDRFTEIPTMDRSDIAREPWSLVPDGAPLEDLIVYYTSGTTGKPMDVLSHPITAAKRLPIYRKALARFGASLEGGSARVAIAFIAAQQMTLTYPTLSTYLGGAAVVKVNLNPADWRKPEDRVTFLDDCDPEIYTGDPLSLLALSELPLKTRPKALISSAMTMLPSIRERIEKRFGAPVVDIYSTCESGPIGLAVEDGFEVLPHDLYVEIIRPDGSQCEAGERGEVTLTGGRNPYLPMLRFRTGDFAAMSFAGATPTIVGLEGRAPVQFRMTDGRLINNMDVTIALRPFPLAKFSVLQKRDGSLEVGIAGARFPFETLERALRVMFGEEQVIRISELPEGIDKVVPYRSEMM